MHWLEHKCGILVDSKSMENENFKKWSIIVFIRKSRVSSKYLKKIPLNAYLHTILIDNIVFVLFKVYEYASYLQLGLFYPQANLSWPTFLMRLAPNRIINHRMEKYESCIIFIWNWK